jgi:hypothetical protein
MDVWAMGHGLPGGEGTAEHPRAARLGHHEEISVQLPQLRRIRWAVRAALFLGVAASVAANVLHAQPNPISQTISAWPPLALLLTVELTSRIPMHKPMLATLRVMATAAIAGIAAWVSYWHMQDVAVRYGETEISAYLLPISVDGLIVVASVSLVELAGRIRLLEDARAKAAAEAAAPAPAVAPVQFLQPTAAAIATPAPVPVFQAPAPTVMAAAPARPAAGELTLDEEFEDLEHAPEPLSAGGAAHGSIRTPRSAPVSPPVGYANGSAPNGSGNRPATTRAAAATTARTMVTESTARAGDSTAPKPRRPVIETAELADAIEAMQPDISEDELASRLGISATRLRQVRREADARRAATRQ